MPYTAGSSNFPENVKKMPMHAREIFESAFNNAYDNCQEKGGEDCEGKAMAIAMSATNRSEDSGEMQRKNPGEYALELIDGAVRTEKTLIRSTLDTPDTTIYYLNGLPYRGLYLGKYDFHETLWGEDSYVGPLGRSFSAFFEHGLFPEIGFDEIGTAQILTDETVRSLINDGVLNKEDIDGRVFRAVVEKAKKYHDFIARLYDEGLLYGSVQALASGFKLDKETRKVQRFVPAEFSFVVDPSNLLAKPIAVVRSFPTNGDYVKEFYEDMAKEKVVETPIPETVPVSNTPTIAEQLDAQIQRNTQLVESEGQDTLQILLRSVLTELTELKVAAAGDNQNDELLRSVATKQEALEQRFVALEAGLVKLAEHFGDALQRAVAQATRNALLLSESEKQNVFRNVQREQTTNAVSKIPVPMGNGNGIPTVTIQPPFPRG